ncbi:MAG TPA: amylo-alpha-1,6-glucosidase [Thermoanaerobaculia bacterium]|nr:amylo-alpha-1,6-glucosidase [Thermoanaerobaculia bacterium]
MTMVVPTASEDPKVPKTADFEPLLSREWLVANGLGGYASGTIAGVATRRYHALLVAALPPPLGRTVMLCQLWERLRFADGRVIQLGGVERVGRPPEIPGAGYLKEFRLEAGLPVWRYEMEGLQLEKRVLLPHLQNSVHILYQLRGVTGQVQLELEPSVHFRGHESEVSQPLSGPYSLSMINSHYELRGPEGYPALRFKPQGGEPTFTSTGRKLVEMYYRDEESRGYPAVGEVWSPGCFTFTLAGDGEASLVASTESREVLSVLSSTEALAAERERRERLVGAAVPAAPAANDAFGATLVLSADSFIVTPARREDAARAYAAGDEPRTVIAGYHWFTDWGRDTMISLEGLTFATGRLREARYILRTFAHYVKDGLIPNLFPEGDREGLYHTADATLWFFHAVDRYLRASGDRETLTLLLPTFLDIAEHHLEGTRFGIGVDRADGLLRQGMEGYQLTWMDAKVDGWVVTPRRGKAVEINALWYNALMLLTGWLREERGGEDPDAERLARSAEQARQSFNRRFWYEEGGYLYDVVDGESGDDPACRPNQVFAISLTHPILSPERWPRVLQVVTERLLTPVGLRSLSPDHPDYKPKYDGDLRSRDAAYHQGTVWAWLIGPYIEAWLRVHPEEKAAARDLLRGFIPHLRQAGVGSISEIFDAEPPYRPRGCIAQAWSVAEVLRCWVLTASA